MEVWVQVALFSYLKNERFLVKTGDLNIIL